MSFSIPLARFCADLCARSYVDATITNDVTDTQVLIAPRSDGLDIIHTGTKDPPGWLRDLDIDKVPFMGARVHHGFFTDVSSVLSAIKCHIPSRQTPLRVMGHSKGGGEATLTAFQLKIDGWNVTDVYTFGGPRVGNQAWRKLYDEALGDVTWRVVHGCDIVPWMPSFNYWHVGREAYLSPRGDVLMCSPTMWQKARLNLGGMMLAYLARKSGLADMFRDHPIAAYQKALAQ